MAQLYLVSFAVGTLSTFFIVATRPICLPLSVETASWAPTERCLRRLGDRSLADPPRSVRRRATSVTGEITYADGSRETIDRGSLIAAPEGALRILWLAILAVALSGLAARWL